MHTLRSGYGHVAPHNYFAYEICPKNNHGCSIVQAALQRKMDLGWIQEYRNQDSYQVNMVSNCPREYQVFRVEYIGGSIVRFHKTLGELAYFGPKCHKYKR